MTNVPNRLVEVQLEVSLILNGLGVPDRAATWVTNSTPLRPRLGEDDHRFRSPQPSSRELIGEAVHLHARSTPPVAFGILALPRGQARTAPPDARRVRSAQPHRWGWLERPVKLHESSGGRVGSGDTKWEPTIKGATAIHGISRLPSS